MTKFMRQSHDVTRLTEVVQHHIRMHRRNGRMCKRARSFARLYGRVDPPFVKEWLGQFGHLRVEITIGVQHSFGCFIPIHQPIIFHRERRVAVPDLHPLQPQPFGLELVVAMAQAGVGRDNGVA